MSSRRLLSKPNSRPPFPPFVKDYLQWTTTTHNTFPLPQSNPPFVPKKPSILATDLLKSYFQKGLVREAHSLFDEMPEKDVVTWTAMISGYASCNEHTSAWSVFRRMVKSGIEPNAFTVSSALKACKGMKELSCGATVHGFAIKCGMEGLIYVDNVLMDMYATCSFTMKDACLVFRGIEEKNAVTWTILISGYTHRGNGSRGLQLFQEMLLEEEESSPHSFSIAVRACASVGSCNYGEQMHAAVIKHGYESNVPVANSVVDMYCKCGCLYEANKCFHEMAERDLVTWNTLIAGYEKLDPKEALLMFSHMELEGFSPNYYTFTSVIAACANLVVLSCGQQIHGGIIQRGLDADSELANAMIDMYAKCGSISDSEKIFCSMSSWNLVSWTSMMIGYGAHGFGKEAVELFDKMVESGIRPDQIAFMAVLSACSHAGLVDQGLKYFNSMVNDYGVKPFQETYGCVVDLLGRAGRLEEAYQIIQDMPFNPDESVWGALLGACRAYCLPSLGKLVARRVLKLRPNRVGTYVMLSNIYAAEGEWGEFAEVRKLMQEMGNKKETGRSWIEVKNEVCSFVVGDKMGSHMEWVYEVLRLLIQHMKDATLMHNIDCLVHDMDGGT